MEHQGRLKIGPADGHSGIEINTVDAYQGREKEIIIVSTVRTEGIGFLQDYRRMNVAITRAKNFMWVVGNQRALSRNEIWHALTKSIQKKYTFDNKTQASPEQLSKTLLLQRVPTSYNDKGHHHYQ